MLSRLRVKQRFRVLWWLFLVSSPLAFFVSGFFGWPDQANRSIACANFYALFYYIILISVFLYKLVAKKTFIFSIPIGLFSYAWLLYHGMFSALIGCGFGWYIHPEAVYVKQHCHPIPFKQDGKTYLLGLCNLQIDSDGQSQFSYIYDTSGDAANATDFQNKTGRKDRIEFVNAIRSIFNDDPNEQFEFANFSTTHIYSKFYFVAFDESDAAGFTLEYGIPPLNCKNSYRSFLYAAPDLKNEHASCAKRQ
jgi:hypothetical protein